MPVDRRAVLFGIGALSFIPPRPAASQSRAMSFRYRDPYELTFDDIAWFRSCRSLWIEAESGAPAILGPDMSPEVLFDLPEAAYETFERRLEPIQCAFFLHAAFKPGRYALAGVDAGAQSSVEVTQSDITLLRHTSWRTFAVDPKRPYGDFTNYPVEMAQALALPVTVDDQGYAAIDPELEDELVALHRKSQFVLQAYIENAELEPGAWTIPFNGWDALLRPRCRPVGRSALARYRAEMIVIARRAEFERSGDLVVPLMRASGALFASP